MIKKLLSLKPKEKAKLKPKVGNKFKVIAGESKLIGLEGTIKDFNHSIVVGTLKFPKPLKQHETFQMIFKLTEIELI